MKLTHSQISATPCLCHSHASATLCLRWAFLYIKAKEVELFDEFSDRHLPQKWVAQMEARARLVKAAGQQFFWLGDRVGQVCVHLPLPLPLPLPCPFSPVSSCPPVGASRSRWRLVRHMRCSGCVRR